MFFLLFVVWVAAELFVAIKVANAIGVLATVVLLLLSWPLGSWVLRSQGRAAWRRLGAAVSAGRSPGREVLDGALVLLGGVLLIVPGFISDVLGVLALLPPTRALMRAPARPQPPEPPGDPRDEVHRRLAAIRCRLHRQRHRPAAAAPMSPTPSELRTLAFGDLERTVWGAAWIPSDDGSAVATLGGDAVAPVVSSLRLSAAEDGGEWRLDGDGVALIASPAGEPVDVHDDDDGIEGFDQLCRVTGRFELDGAEHEVDCLGLRSSRSGGFDLAKLESVRAVSTWFEPDEGLALIAFRGRKAKPHDGDVVTAAVLGPEPSAPVEDPRLSTTYDAGGWPVRAGLELWLAGDGEEEQFPAARVRRGRGRPGGDRGRRARPASRAVPMAQPRARGRRDLHPGPPAMSRVRAIISDFGGVLTSPLLESFAGLMQSSGISLESVGKAMATIAERKGSNPLFELETGRVTEAAFFAALEDELSAADGGTVTLDGFGERYFQHLEPNEPMIEYMRELRGRGYKMAICTNNIREWEAHWRAMLPVDEIFDVVVDSAFVGSRKPEPRIYEITLERLGASPEEAVFIDDVEVNCEGARKLGITAIRFRSTEQAIEEIEAALREA